MGKKSKAAYVVFRGRKPGIFYTWAETEDQVKGFPNNRQQGFGTVREAEVVWQKHCSEQQANTTSQRPLQEVTLNSQSQSTVNTTSNLKRSRASIDSAVSDNDEPPAAKKVRSYAADEDRDFIPLNFELEPEPNLSAEQQAVVDMALKGDNIFLTGAAGSGKTVALKAIMRRFRERETNYQVVAPTGIAALPLGGKTTYSFLGWKPDSLSKSISVLQENASKRVIDVVRPLQVLVVEEISMVENQFLERMNLFLQAVRKDSNPFGGIQLIFLGDFHQLPPVKPFQYCLLDGRFMSKSEPYFCDMCITKDKENTFKDSDKWAFKAPVWKHLQLRMIHLQQIHRQKDERFQEILNKIRHGIPLDDRRWHDLEKKKILPYGIKAIRLMSLRRQVDQVNFRELAAIESRSLSWKSTDSYRMLRSDQISTYLPWELEQPLKDCRLSERLELKLGAKVVLLVNLDSGLVNGSQGEVIGFAVPEPQTSKEKAERRSRFEREQYESFQDANIDSLQKQYLEPVVRFANGGEVAIRANTITTMYGNNQVRYLGSRTQVPLALGWALSIHKSQGMTLDYVEVSKKDIFERGQLYVALSRGTTLDGLIVTGTSREQMEVDSDVVEFYENNNWEDLSQLTVKKDSLTPTQAAGIHVDQDSSTQVQEKLLRPSNTLTAT